MAASARTLGWAQRRLHATANNNPTYVNAIVGTGTAGDVQTPASDGTFEVTAGSSVTISWGWNSSNTTPDGFIATNSVIGYLAIYYETGTNLYDGASASATVSTGTGTTNVTCHASSGTLTGGAAAQDKTFTFSFTPTHTGTVRLFVRLQTYNTSTKTITADYNSDGGNGFGGPTEVIPATMTPDNATPGLMRAGTALTAWSLSSGAATVYYPSTQQNQWTYAASEGEAVGTISIAWKQGATTVVTTTIAAQQTTDTAQKVSWFTGFAASATAVTLVANPSNSALSTANSGTGLPWVHFTSVPAGVTNAGDPSQVLTYTNAFTADPRIVVDHLLQKNSNSFATPPMSANISTYQRLTTDLGFVATRVRNNNAQGQNGLTVVQTLRDQQNLTSELSASSTTATQGGEAGWTSLMAWSASLPGGTWPMDDQGGATLFSVSDANGSIPTSYMITPSQNLTLLATNPNIKATITREPTNTSTDTWAPGDDLNVFFAIIDGTPGVFTCLTPDANSVDMAILYQNPTTKSLQALGLDNVFHNVTSASYQSYAMSVSPNDVCQYTYKFPASATATWPETGLILFAQGSISGTPYVVATPLF